jgi:hypothetical protein
LKEFRIVRFTIESLEVFGLDLYKTCPACPTGSCTVALDGNFRLGRLRNSSKRDTYEDVGIEFFILNADSTKSSASRPSEKTDDAECSNFEAGSALRGSSAMDEKGLFGGFCARHEYPLAFAHLFHGERYAYPDMVLEEIFKRTNAARGMIFYDIACNYMKHVKVSTFST